MKSLVIGVVLGAGLMLAAAVAMFSPRPVLAQGKPNPGTPDNGFVVLASPLPEGGQQLLVVDPTERAMSVYHISPKNGEITLKSVRNIHWDLRMSQFNGVTPLPNEIRSLVEQH